MEKPKAVMINGRWVIPPNLPVKDRPCRKSDKGKRVQKIIYSSCYRILCDDCDNTFVTTNKKRRYCNDCKKYHPTTSNLPFSYTCEICGKTVGSKKDGPKKRICSRCGQKYRAFRLFARDGLKCFYCGRSSYKDDVTLHAEHVIPRSKGGRTRFDNMVTSCSVCNLSKNDMELEDEVLSEIQEEIKRRNDEFDIPGYTKVIGIT